MATTKDNVDKVYTILQELSDIGINAFKDDIKTLKTLVICYRYVEKKLNDENMDPNLLEEFKKQESLLGKRMFNQLKTLEADCTAQLWMNEDYEDQLLFETRENTQAIKENIQYYRWRHVHRENDNKQLVKYCEKLLRRIKKLGVEIVVSQIDDVVVRNLNLNLK